MTQTHLSLRVSDQLSLRGFGLNINTLRFQAEMAQLLMVLMVVNMLGAILVVPAFYSILRPRIAIPAPSRAEPLAQQRKS